MTDKIHTQVLNPSAQLGDRVLRVYLQVQFTDNPKKEIRQTNHKGEAKTGSKTHEEDCRNACLLLKRQRRTGDKTREHADYIDEGGSYETEVQLTRAG